MKFFLFMCCMAHLLTGISSRIRRTTPMTSALRSGDAEERQVAKFAEIIDFVNSGPNNDGRRSSFAKRLDSRRLNEVMAAMYGFAELKEIQNVDNFALVRNIEDKVLHDIVDDPEVLMEHRVRQTNSNTEEIQDDTPFDALQYSTAENKWDDFRVAPEVTEASTPNENATVQLRRRAQDNIQESTIYRPSFSDDEDNEKSITDGIKLEKIYNEPNTDEEHPFAPPEMNKTDELQNRTLNNKSSSKKDRALINKKEGDTPDSKETGTKKEDNKDYRSIKFIYSQEKLNEDSIRPKDETDDKINKETVDLNEKRGKDKNQKDRSGDKNDSNLTSVERSIFKRDNNLHSNRDRIEQYSIYLHKGRSENSEKQSEKNHEKIDIYDKRMKKRFHDIRGEKESEWIKVDTQKDYEESLKDRNEDKWDKKERDWDKNHDEWSNKEKYWNKNDGRLSKKQKDWDDNDRWNKKEKDWDIDDGLTMKEKYWNNKIRDHDKDKGFDTIDYERMKRHQEYDKHENDAQLDHNENQRKEKIFKEIDNFYKKRDGHLNKRDNDWNKRDSGENENRDRTYDRHESGNKKSYESVDQDRNVRHDRYKVVDRVDSVSSRNDDFERSF